MKRPRRIRSRYRNYLSLEALVIVLVLGCFHFLPDKKWASVITSLLFIGSTVGIIFWETRFEGFKKHPSFWGALFFLIFSALPIFALRLTYWDLAFDEIQVAGWTGSFMHRASNHIFILMMVCFFADSYMETVKLRKIQ